MALLELLGVWIVGPRDEEVPWNTATPIDLPRGSDVAIELVLVDTLAKPIDLNIAGSDRLVLSVRQTFDTGLLFSIQASKLSEIGRYRFSFASNQTIDYSGKLIYDVWATWNGSQQRVIAASYLNLNSRIAYPP